MRLKFIWPGKTKDEHLRALIAEYLKRLQRFVRCEVVETRAAPDVDKESRRILEAIPANSVVLLLDVTGREWTSHELAEQVRKWESGSVKEVAVVIGGQDGFNSEVTDRAQKRWRLSRLTFTHEMARVLVLEQIYRAYAINHGLPYQK